MLQSCHVLMSDKQRDFHSNYLRPRFVRIATIDSTGSSFAKWRRFSRIEPVSQFQLAPASRIEDGLRIGFEEGSRFEVRGSNEDASYYLKNRFVHSGSSRLPDCGWPGLLGDGWIGRH